MSGALPHWGFEIDWKHEALDGASNTFIKRFNAEIHSQSAIEAVLELQRQHHIDRTRSSLST